MGLALGGEYEFVLAFAYEFLLDLAVVPEDLMSAVVKTAKA